MEDKEFVGKAIFYYPSLGIGLIRLESDLRVGDEVLVKGSGTSFKQRVTSMDVKIEDTVYLPIKVARAGNIVGLKVDKKVQKGDLIYRILKTIPSK